MISFKVVQSQVKFIKSTCPSDSGGVGFGKFMIAKKRSSDVKELNTLAEYFLGSHGELLITVLVRF